MLKSSSPTETLFKKKLINLLLSCYVADWNFLTFRMQCYYYAGLDKFLNGMVWLVNFVETKLSNFGVGWPSITHFHNDCAVPWGQLGLCTSLIGCTVGHKYFDKMQLLFVVSTCFSCKMLFCVSVCLCACLCVSEWFVSLPFLKFVSKNLSGCFGADTWTDPLGVLQFVLGGTEYPRQGFLTEKQPWAKIWNSKIFDICC